MPFDDNGFLGKDATIFSNQIRERNKDLFECCYEVNRFAQRLKNELPIQRDPQKYIPAVFFVRVIESAQAAIILVERGFKPEASTVLRSAYDSLTYLKCSAENEEFVSEYLLYAETKSMDALKNILDLKLYKKENIFGDEENVKKMISEIENEFSKRGVKISDFRKRFHKKELAKKANLSDFYTSFYSSTSDAAHTGIGALLKHVKIDESNKIVEIIHGPTDETASIHLFTAAEFILLSSTYICELSRIDKTNEIEALRKKLAS